MEGSGAGSVLVTCGSGRPEDIQILQIRIRMNQQHWLNILSLAY
jgi:hypothetical protein